MLTPARAELLLGLPVTQQRWQTVVLITPEKARVILDAQPRQRPVNRLNVEKIKTAILAGKFLRTHQGIAFDTDGALSDGQHRLEACAQAGMPIEVLASFNEPRDMFTAYDGGALRGMGTHLYLAGLTNETNIGNSVAAAARFVWLYDQGINPTNRAISRNEWCFDAASAALAAHPLLPAMVHRVKSNRRVAFPLGPTAGMFSLMAEGHPQKAEAFIHQCLSGENIGLGDPAHTVRESLLIGKGKDDVEKIYKIARGWNAFYDGRKIRHVYGSAAPGSSNRVRTKDAFPEIAGYKRPGQERGA